MAESRLKELGEALIDYLTSTEVRMSRREVDDFLSRIAPKPTSAEISSVLARLLIQQRLARVGTVMKTPDRDDGLYCLPSKTGGSTLVESSTKRPKRSRYSVARGAPTDELTRRSPPENIEGTSGGSWSRPQKPSE